MVLHLSLRGSIRPRPVLRAGQAFSLLKNIMRLPVWRQTGFIALLRSYFRNDTFTYFPFPSPFPSDFCLSRWERSAEGNVPGTFSSPSPVTENLRFSRYPSQEKFKEFFLSSSDF